jgi:hypothetical protein
MIPSLTIDFDVVKAKQNGRSAVCGKCFVLIHLSRQIELDEPREVVPPPFQFYFLAHRKEHMNSKYLLHWVAVKIALEFRPT